MCGNYEMHKQDVGHDHQRNTKDDEAAIQRDAAEESAEIREEVAA